MMDFSKTVRENKISSLDDVRIAIIGMAFRFPQDIRTEQALWDTLRLGKCCISQIPQERWPVRELQHTNRLEPGRSVTFAAGVLSHLDAFDADFFEISPREAAWLDPQQRLLLEMAYEATENANLPSSKLSGTKCGVFVGISSLDYGLHALEDLASMSSHSMTGSTLSLAANRVSYVFNLHGPSMAVDTACSSSLAALHHACQALRSGEVTTAFAGGVNLLLHPYSFVGFSKASMLSPTGRCRPFDAQANGYVRAEGGAMLLLKPLFQALEDNDPIHAVIIGSGVNADGGRKTGITLPSAAGQAELLDDVLRKSGLTAHEIDFFEAHGTGTAVGDPVEASAIGHVYGHDREHPLPLSSVKANLGHLEPASGMTGLIKAMMVLKKQALPPMPFDFSPNPNIDFCGLNLCCPSVYTPLKRKDGKALIAGINSFGFGGVNAHVLVQEFRQEQCVVSEGAHLPHPPLLFSAKSAGALRELAGSYARLLDGVNPAEYYDIAHSAFFCRDWHEKRVAVLASTPGETVEALQNFSHKKNSASILQENALSETGGIAFIYTGNGAQWPGMGRALFEESSRFADLMTSFDEEIRPWTGFSIVEALLDDRSTDLSNTTISQPLLFAMQIAVTTLLQEQGIIPHAVMGHSVGEIAAAWAAGALDRTQAAHVVCARSQAQFLTRGQGRMAAVGLAENAAKKLIEELGIASHVELAGSNSPHNVTLSGTLPQLLQIKEYTAPRDIFFHLLDLDHAFHCKQMDAIRDVLLCKLNGLAPLQTHAATFVSSVTGDVLPGSALDSEYWWRNVREPVRFSDAVATLVKRGCRLFVEISPNAILQHYIRDCLNSLGVKGRVLGVLRRKHANLSSLMKAATRIHLLAGSSDTAAVFPKVGKRVSLPSYPWQRKSCWHPQTNECFPQRRRVHPLLGWPLLDKGFFWENILDPATDLWLADHKVDGAIIFPGAGYIEMALAAGQVCFDEESLTIEYLDILAPLVFEDSRAQTVRCSLNSKDGSFQIESRVRLGTEDWTPHATGRVLKSAGRVPTANLQVLPANSQTISGSVLYGQTAALGLEYGPAFQVVASMRVEADRLDAFLAPDTLNDEEYALHPICLDTCFHSLVALYEHSFVQPPQTAFLPVKTGRIDFCRKGRVLHIRLRARRQGSRSIAADCELFDAENMLLAKLSDCRFQAMPFMRRERASINTWKMTPWLQVHPVDVSLSEMPFPEELIEHLRTCPLESQERSSWFRQALPLVEALALSYAFSAFRAIACNNANWHESVSGPYTQWLMSLLHQEDLLHNKDGTWQLSEQDEMPLPDELWRQILERAPDCLPQLLLVGRIGRRLEDILSGGCDGYEVLQEVRAAPVTKDLHQTDPAYIGIRSSLDQITAHLVQQLRPGRRLRILEIEPCAGTLAEMLLEKLPEDSFQYVMALADPGVRNQTRLRYERNLAVSILSFDAALWTFADKPLPPGLFDVIIVHHALHRAANITEALGRTRQALATGGLLLAAERHADWSVDFVEGLDPAWWLDGSQTRKKLPLSSLLSPQVWLHAFAEAGFVHCRFCKEPAGQDLAEGAYLLLAATPEEDRLTRPVPERASWLLLADETSRSLALDLSARLELQGQQTILQCEPRQRQTADLDHVIFMRGAKASPDEAAASLNDLLRCVHAYGEQKERGRLHLWIITQGGAPSAGLPRSYRARPAQCALWGFGRVIMNEYPAVCCTLVDLSPDMTVPDMAAGLEKEILHPDGLAEILLTREARYGLMFQEEIPSQSEIATVDTRFRLDFSTPGHLQNLIWMRERSRPLPPDAIEAQVIATGLNFRDVMLVMGLVPDDAVEDGFSGPNLGLEFSGVVVRTGAKVRSLKAGDAVLGFAPSCFASHVTTPAYAVSRIPESLSPVAAATIPTAFFTAYYALKHLAQVQPGERVLIHGAAGGVGLAAIQVARYLGAEIFASAGSDEKRDFLRLLGVEFIFDSRSVSFAHDVREATNGQGVDAVLNSLAGEAMRQSIAILKPFGRFLELGKRDFVENTSLGLRPFKNNISYFAIDADQLLTKRPRLAHELFQELMGLFLEGVLTPLPYRIFPLSQTTSAFRTMQQSRHIGKIVVACDAAPPCSPQAPLSHKRLWQGKGSWLISGGLSGFGLASAYWLAERGVKHLVLAGRRGLATPNVAQIVSAFAEQGVKVHVETCDMGDAAAVHALVRRVCTFAPPLQGIIHAAAVFDDRFVAQLDPQSLQSVLRPKLFGAWSLHEASQGVALEYFVLYSSVSTVLGNPGQANYVAANAGLEGLAQLRRHLGLPVTCVAWGPIGDAGYLARHQSVKKNLEQLLGKPPLSACDALSQLDEALAWGGEVRTLANFDWNTVKRLFLDNPPSRFEYVLHNAVLQGDTETAEDIRSRLRGKNSKEIKLIIRNLIRKELAQTLGLDPELIDPDRSLQSLGMDSLMAVELALVLEEQMGMRFPALMLQGAPTLEQIAERLVARMSNAEQDAGDDNVDAARTLVHSHGEELSGFDVELMVKGERTNVGDEHEQTKQQP